MAEAPHGFKSKRSASIYICCPYIKRLEHLKLCLVSLQSTVVLISYNLQYHLDPYIVQILSSQPTSFTVEYTS